MKLANCEIIGLINTLSSIQDKDIPVLFTYKLFDIYQKLQDSYQIYTNTLENIMKKNETDNPDDPKIRAEVEKLLNLMVNVEIEKIKRQELIDTGIELSLAQLSLLSPIIEG